MRTTRSQASVAQCFSSWPRTKASQSNKFATASAKTRSKYIEPETEPESECASGSDYEGESDNDVAFVQSQSTKNKSRPKDQAPKDEKVAVDGKAASIFKNDVPMEVHQHIANFLPSDKDVFNYSLICKTTASSITDSVWRERAIRTFDIVEGETLEQVVVKYAFRQDISRQWTCFDLRRFGGSIDRETRRIQMANAYHCVQLFKGLILESNAKRVCDQGGNLVIQGKNLQYMCDLISGANGKSYLDILDAVLLTGLDEKYMRRCGFASLFFAHKTTIADPDTLVLYTVQVCLAWLSLHPEYSHSKSAHFDLSQYSVYAMSHLCPIFLGDQKEIVNVRWLLHAINFFKYHLRAAGEGLLSHAYKELSKDQYPQPWTGKIQQGILFLGKNWKGAHTYMATDDLKQLRLSPGTKSVRSEHTVYPDALDGGETFSDICVFFDEQQYSADLWPKQWEEILESNTFKESNTPSKTGSYKGSKAPSIRPEIKYFWGSSRGTKTGHFFGALHSMGEQQGIPGFQRMVLMMFYTKIDENNEEIYDPEQVWAYEGCVLPGGKIVTGRWWEARATNYEFRQGGPFIWWNVERSDADIPIKSEEAFEFLDTVQVESVFADW